MNASSAKSIAISETNQKENDFQVFSQRAVTLSKMDSRRP